MTLRRTALVAGALVLLAACGARPSLGEPAGVTTTGAGSPAAQAAPPPSAPTTVAAPTTAARTTAAPTTAAPTTAAPVTVPRDRTGGIYAIGDSVMLGAVPALEKGIPGITVDAIESRSFMKGVGVLRKLGKAGRLPRNVVVHLGTNGPVTASQCDTLMDVLAGHRVVLLNLKVPRPWEADNNLVLADCAHRRGAVLADWQALALEHPSALYNDGIHLRPPEGALVYTGLVDRNV